MAFNKSFTDLAITPTGDLIIGPDGDLLLHSGSQAVLDTILFRLKTVAGDYALRPGCGASLEQFIGQPNSRQTGTVIEAEARAALTEDGLFDGSQVIVRATPINPNEVALYVSVSVDDDKVTLFASLDLRLGQLTIAN